MPVFDLPKVNNCVETHTLNAALQAQAQRGWPQSVAKMMNLQTSLIDAAVKPAIARSMQKTIDSIERLDVPFIGPRALPHADLPKLIDEVLRDVAPYASLDMHTAFARDPEALAPEAPPAAFARYVHGDVTEAALITLRRRLDRAESLYLARDHGEIDPKMHAATRTMRIRRRMELNYAAHAEQEAQAQIYHADSTIFANSRLALARLAGTIPGNVVVAHNPNFMRNFRCRLLTRLLKEPLTATTRSHVNYILAKLLLGDAPQEHDLGPALAAADEAAEHGNIEQRARAFVVKGEIVEAAMNEFYEDGENTSILKPIQKHFDVQNEDEVYQRQCETYRSAFEIAITPSTRIAAARGLGFDQFGLPDLEILDQLPMDRATRAELSIHLAVLLGELDLASNRARVISLLEYSLAYGRKLSPARLLAALGEGENNYYQRIVLAQAHNYFHMPAIVALHDLAGTAAVGDHSYLRQIVERGDYVHSRHRLQDLGVRLALANAHHELSRAGEGNVADHRRLARHYADPIHPYPAVTEWASVDHTDRWQSELRAIFNEVRQDDLVAEAAASQAAQNSLPVSRRARNKRKRSLTA